MHTDVLTTGERGQGKGNRGKGPGERGKGQGERGKGQGEREKGNGERGREQGKFPPPPPRFVEVRQGGPPGRFPSGWSSALGTVSDRPPSTLIFQSLVFAFSLVFGPFIFSLVFSFFPWCLLFLFRFFLGVWMGFFGLTFVLDGSICEAPS